MIFMSISINLCIFTKVVQNPWSIPQTWKVDHFQNPWNSLFSKPAPFRSREGLFWRTGIYGTSRWCWYPAIVGSDSWDLNLSQKFDFGVRSKTWSWLFCWKFAMLLFWKLANCWGIFLNPRVFVCEFVFSKIYHMIPRLDPFSNGPPFSKPYYKHNPHAMTPVSTPETKKRLRIRTVGLEKTTRFYQASTSELYGMVQEVPQKASWCRTMDIAGW